MEDETIVKLRRKVAYNRGLRKVRAEAELVEALATMDNAEALELGRTTVKRARELLRNARERRANTASYEKHLALSLRSQVWALHLAERYTEAGEALDEAIHFFQHLDEGYELIKCYQLQHMHYRKQDNNSAALKALETALAVARRIGNHTRDALIYGAMGAMYTSMGDTLEAVAAFENGLAAARNGSDRRAEVVVLGGAGRSYVDFGFPDKALEFYTKAEEVYRGTPIPGSGKSRIANLMNMAALSYRRGNVGQGVEYLTQAAAIAAEARLGALEPYVLSQIANLQMSLGEYNTALDNLQRAIAICRAGHHSMVLALCLALLGALFYFADDEQTARNFFQRSCSVLRSIAIDPDNQGTELAQTLMALAYHKTPCLDMQRFIESLNKRLQQTGKHDSAVNQINLRLALGQYLEHTGSVQPARREFGHVLELSRRHDFPYSQCNVQLLSGRLELENGNLRAAGQYLSTALLIALDLGLHGLAGTLYKLLIRQCEQSGAESSAEDYRSALDTLERKLLRREVLLTLQLAREQYDNAELRQTEKTIRAELGEAQAAIAAQQRLLDSKDAHIRHLSDSLQSLAVSLRHDGAESDLAYRLRTEAIADDIGTILAEKNWRAFEQEAQGQDDDFLVRLARTFPELTATERKVCSLMRLHHTTKELSALLNISARSVQAYRYRIRKKLGIPSEADLNAWILGMLYPETS